MEEEKQEMPNGREETLQNEKHEEHSDDTDIDMRFGFACCKAQCIQFFNKTSWYTFFIFWANFIQSLVTNGLIGVVLSTLEKRFSLTSTQSSWIASVYDLASVPTIIVASYIGARCHRPFWTSIGQFTVMAGSILFALPHFTTNQVLLSATNTSDEALCLLNSTEPRPEDGTNGESSLQLYLIVFIIARMLHGLGMTPLYTICVTYLDDMSTKEAFSLYVVIFYVGGIVGPACSFALGGLLLNLYTDFYAVDEESLGLDPSDPRWIGNWWLGFLIGAFLLLCGGLPIMGYPRDMPGAAAIRANKKTEAHNAKQDELSSGNDLGLKLSETPSYFKTVCTNPTFFGICVYNCCDLAIVAGFTAFGPKIVEEMLSMSPAAAGVSFGLITIPGGVGGLLIGGYVIKRFQMRCTTIMKMCTTVSVLFMLAVFCLFVECERYSFAGVNAPYLNDSSSSGFISDCNMNCGCDSLSFQPVCSHDNIQYFSPCHAGCEDIYTLDDSAKEYFNCSCIVNPNQDAGIPDATRSGCATSGCPIIAVFFVGFFIAMTFMFICSGALISVIVRCVPSTHRSFAIGVSSLVPRLVAGPLGPFLFGVVLDDSCELWDGDGACRWYNVNRMQVLLFLLIFAVKGLSLVALIFGTCLYHAPKEESIIDDVIITNEVTNDAEDNGNKENDSHENGDIKESGISTISNGYLTEETAIDNEEPPPYLPYMYQNGAVLQNTQF